VVPRSLRSLGMTGPPAGPQSQTLVLARVALKNSSCILDRFAHSFAITGPSDRLDCIKKIMLYGSSIASLKWNDRAFGALTITEPSDRRDCIKKIMLDGSSIASLTRSQSPGLLIAGIALKNSSWFLDRFAQME
jgi:hypothetical protein